ncbi:MAG: lipoyl(octanoyl) transferase LipB [Actinomycetota bacterium]
MKPLRRVDAGVVPYRTALEWQRSLHARRLEGEIDDVVLLLEHPHTVTLGRRFDPAHLPGGRELLIRRGAEVCEADRGGSITYHGPGQLVAYPVIDLRRPNKLPDFPGYLRTLEAAIVDTVMPMGIAAGTRSGLTGVWVGGAKLASIGVNISRGVSRHGLALNVSTDLSWFDYMVPCGIQGGAMTSLNRLLPEAPLIDQVAEALARRLAEHLGRRLLRVTPGDLGLRAPRHLGIGA